MRADPTPHHDIARALTALFGAGHPFSFPAALPDSMTLKKTFHRRSLAVHPDRALSVGRRAEALTREFQDLNDAYRLVNRIAAPEERAAGPRRENFRAAGRPAAPRDFFWTLAVPAVPLKFAQFVYYRGLIGIRQLGRVLARQVTDRPRVGELALSGGLLERAAIAVVLARRAPHALFLETAVRLGFLDEAGARRVLLRQRACLLPVGTVLVREGLLSAQRRDRLLREFHAHNAAHGRRAAS